MHAQGPCRKFLGNQLSSHWFQNFCSHLTCCRGQRSLWNRQGYICLQSLSLQKPACPFGDGVCIHLFGLCIRAEKLPDGWLQCVEQWLTHQPQVPEPKWGRGALGMGSGSGKNFFLADWKYFPGFLLQVSRCGSTESVGGSLCEATSVPFGDQMFLRRSWVWVSAGDPTLLAVAPDTASLRPKALPTGF